MNKKGLAVSAVALSLAFAPSAHAYSVSVFGAPGVDALAMANSLLAGASGITINSATYTGASQASGIFTGGNPPFGIDQGIVLTSGSATIFGANGNGFGGYAPLQLLNGGLATHDASVLDIKFVPTGSNISFKYVFASREYPQYVDSQYNDVFAFYVNGTAPADNYALIPGTATPVAINTINCGNSSGVGAKPHCDLFVDNRTGSIPVDLGGWTQVFNLIAPVIPNVENELILAIADTSDSTLDSAALIQSGSFTVCGGPGQPACDGGTVPEPGSLFLLGGALLGFAGLRTRRKH